MTEDMAEMEYQRFWKSLQQLGLNAYESRSYLVLLGHPRFKALELAARAHVPRQKIYEVLDSLVEKGFANVLQDRTKVFSAVEPNLAIPGYLARKRQILEFELRDQARDANSLMQDLDCLYSRGKGGRGTLDFLRIVSEPTQIATEYRRMLDEVKTEYLEFSRPPYAVDPLQDPVEPTLVHQARANGISCRLIIESGNPELTVPHRQRLAEYRSAGVRIRQSESLPLKMALFDSTNGMIALLDPVVGKPSWTSVVFDHAGLGEAMKHLFEDRWARATEFPA